jgi:hypothetical protein
MKNLSINKMPQATCIGDVTGGSVVRGKAWGILFLREVINQWQAKKRAASVRLHRDSPNHNTHHRGGFAMAEKINTKVSKLRQGQNEVPNASDFKREIAFLQKNFIKVLKTVINLQNAVVYILKEENKQLELELGIPGENDIGLKILDGGKKLEEEQPPFAPQPQS